MCRPTRWRSAARRGPTPFRNCSGDCSGSIARPSLPPAHADLLDAGGQFERVVHVDARRFFRRLRIVREQFLHQALGNRDAGDFCRLELEPADAVLGDEQSRGGQWQPAGHVAHGIGPRALLLLADGVEVDDGAAAHAPFAESVERRIDDASRDLVLQVVVQIRVELAVSELRGLRARERAFAFGARLRRRREALDPTELSLEAVGVLLAQARLCRKRQDDGRHHRQTEADHHSRPQSQSHTAIVHRLGADRTTRDEFPSEGQPRLPYWLARERHSGLP